jgi:hypothetical protein
MILSGVSRRARPGARRPMPPREPLTGTVCQSLASIGER